LRVSNPKKKRNLKKIEKKIVSKNFFHSFLKKKNFTIFHKKFSSNEKFFFPKSNDFFYLKIENFASLIFFLTNFLCKHTINNEKLFEENERTAIGIFGSEKKISNKFLTISYFQFISFNLIFS